MKVNSFSPDLQFALTCFFSQLVMGQINTPESLAQACDKISDLAWAEAEDEETDLTPPSMRFDGAG